MKNTKKITRTLIMTLLLSLFIPCIGYGAEPLTLTKSYPSDGAGGFEPVNMNVKLWFNKDVLDPSVQSTNGKVFSIKTVTGAAVKFDVLYNTKKGHISLLLREDLVSDTEYVVTIGKGLTATDKSTLGADQTLRFTTRDVNKDTTYSMIMMVIMVAVMVGVTSLQTKRQAEKQAKESTEKVNPYKVAKEKNTTVEKVLKERQKNQNNAAKNKAEISNTAAQSNKAPANKGKSTNVKKLKKK